jgi:CheY-like chemotaxis protein
MKKKILVVEDNHSIRMAISEILEIDYIVFQAENYNQALTVLKSELIDLLITDIKMPGKSGLDLIKFVRSNYPNILYSLITAYNINDFIHFAKEHKVFNIIPKYSSLDLNYIAIMVKKLLFSDIFGVEKYFPNLTLIDSDLENKQFLVPHPNQIVYKTIKSDMDRNHISERIGKFLVEKGAPQIIHQVIDELTSNAMIRAPRDNSGNSKYQYELPSHDLIVSLQEIHLSENDYFKIGYGYFGHTFIITTIDHFGALRKEEILFRLDRHLLANPKTGLPDGIKDSHGRGLFICREVSDQIIFNIEKGSKTEVIAIIEERENKSFKSLSIFEI